ncbi:NAD(P)H-quinone oxidoreductase [Fulvivirga sp. 29W222]|uniref:NAD(P)H-quinone oxidoreductase n=1 Tax=Fulvivirga marina TaxID=2494733 RepID=A0A937FVD3_9BACT|nr:NAD(P)H-quinone oxidoreductase [Fulvivirga marina]MBL6445627.1 NAD(P)H-quinone oxidoreductase [Fulvivirga marina]
MKAIVITSPGGPEVLKVENRDMPEISEGEVLIEVKAAGINRPDIFQRKGNYPAPPGVPADIPGLEVAGIVKEAKGEGSRWKPGDKVCALLGGGGYAEYAVVSAGQCLPIPEGLDFAEAASLPETFFTVWTNVFDRAGFKKGENVLVHGGTSGIGVAAIQMVKAMGGKAYTTAGSSDKCRFAEEIGAERAVNYKEQDFEAELMAATNNEGIDIVLDMIGGDYTPKNINLLRTEGRIVMINAMKGRVAEVDLIQVMRKRLVITGSTLRPRDNAFKHEIAQKLEQHIWPHLANKAIKPVVYKTFPIEDASEAHRLMESSNHIGKIILSVD